MNPLKSMVAASLTCAILAGCEVQPMGNPAVKPIALTTSTVKIVGSDARLEWTADEEHVGYWDNSSTFFQWALKNVKPGKYKIEALYSLDPGFAGSTIAVEMAGQAFTKKLAATKDWNDYRPLDLGTVSVERPEDLTLTVKATDKPMRYVMNLKKLILTPTK
ncbi:MAG TPA: hypothetical protein VGN88_07735 [Phycisphaerae bacterium]|jgi:hypothetical protein